MLVDTTFNHSASKKSFEELRSVDGVLYETYKKTCQALGLLDDDELWHSTMEEARNNCLPREMRQLFVSLLSAANLSEPKLLFDKFCDSMAEDYENQLLPPDNEDKELLRAMVLLEIQERLESLGKADIMCQLGHVTEEMKQRIAAARGQHRLFHEWREIREELAYD